MNHEGNVSLRTHPAPRREFEIFVMFEDAEGIGWTKTPVDPGLRHRSFLKKSIVDQFHLLPELGIRTDAEQDAAPPSSAEAPASSRGSAVDPDQRSLLSAPGVDVFLMLRSAAGKL
jgi:hypothetical protein